LIIKDILAAVTGLSVALALAACGSAPRRAAAPPRDIAIARAAEVGSPITIYVIKRSWHTDIGFYVADLHPPLATLRPALPEARYLLFGFGDKHYLLNRGNSFEGMVGAVWPGEGLVLMTGVEGTPEQAFGVAGVTRLRVSAAQAEKLEEFVWNTLATHDGIATALAPGPYDQSLYYPSTQRYSGLRTCNTWTAEGLRSAGLPVHSFGVEFSWQVWPQVRRLTAERLTAQRLKSTEIDGAAPAAGAAHP
jgi:uncharacterized protein (TIGR02117 family)